MISSLVHYLIQSSVNLYIITLKLNGFRVYEIVANKLDLGLSEFEECKKHFCKLSFSHDTADKQSIIEQQAKFVFSFSNKVDVNLHRNYSYFLDEETMQSYVFIERCLSCE